MSVYNIVQVFIYEMKDTIKYYMQYVYGECCLPLLQYNVHL